MSTVDEFIRDLKDVVWEVKGSPAGKGTMVTLYGACSNRVTDLGDLGLRPRLLSPLGGRRSPSFPLPSIRCPLRKADYIFGPDPGLGSSSAIGPEMVGAVVSAFLDALYKA